MLDICRTGLIRRPFAAYWKFTATALVPSFFVLVFADYDSFGVFKSACKAARAGLGPPAALLASCPFCCLLTRPPKVNCDELLNVFFFFLISMNEEPLSNDDARLTSSSRSILMSILASTYTPSSFDLLVSFLSSDSIFFSSLLDLRELSFSSLPVSIEDLYNFLRLSRRAVFFSE